MYFFALAIGTGAFEQGVSAGVSAAARAIIGGGTGQELAPAIFAQVIVGFADALAAVDADCRPEQLV